MSRLGPLRERDFRTLERRSAAPVDAEAVTA
jgi:hypothetical protein